MSDNIPRNYPDFNTALDVFNAQSNVEAATISSQSVNRLFFCNFPTHSTRFDVFFSGYSTLRSLETNLFPISKALLPTSQCIFFLILSTYFT